MKNNKKQLIENKIRQIIKEVLNEADQLNDDDLINKTLSLIEKQIGLKLKLDTHFTGMKVHNGQKYFNVELSQKTSESSEYDRLERFANKYKLIKIAPNGVRRVSIFLTDKLINTIQK